MMTFRPSLALVALGLAVSACGSANRGLESVNQPVVQRTDYVFDVQAGSGGLASGEAQRLQDWFTSLEVGYGDRVAVDSSGAYGYGSGRETVAAVAARFGLLLSDSTPVIAGDPAPGTVRVIISRMRAGVPGCANWDRGSQPEYSSATMSNYGCATNKNLAAMVANPEDLVRGREGVGSGDAAVSVKAIDTYRNAVPTGKGGLIKESAGSK
jgi:pilus assembly protein CpaD